jgi:hypothetical protein
VRRPLKTEKLKAPDIQPIAEVKKEKRNGSSFLMITKEEVHRIIYQCCNIDIMDFYKN